MERASLANERGNENTYHTKKGGKPLFFTQWADPSNRLHAEPGSLEAAALRNAKREASYNEQHDMNERHRKLRSEEEAGKLGNLEAGRHRKLENEYGYNRTFAQEALLSRAERLASWTDKFGIVKEGMSLPVEWTFLKSDRLLPAHGDPGCGNCTREYAGSHPLPQAPRGVDPFGPGVCADDPTMACKFAQTAGVKWHECDPTEGQWCQPLSEITDPKDPNAKFGFDCHKVGPEDILSLGKSPAKASTAFGAEFMNLPVFGGDGYVKIPQMLWPNSSASQPLVFDVRQIHLETIYNKYLDIFSGNLDDAQFSTFDANLYDDSRPQPRNALGSFDIETREGNGVPNGKINKNAEDQVLSITNPDTDTGETDTYVNWLKPEYPRYMPRYWKVKESGGEYLEPVYDESEVPEQLRHQDYDEYGNQGLSYKPHTGRRATDWCYDCGPDDPDKCESEIHRIVMQDGAIVRYRWYKFRYQPSLQQLAREFPKKYSEPFLNNLQSVWAKIHQEWGNGETDQFLKRPQGRGNYDIARLDPTTLVTPPAGKEHGWVPIVLELRRPGIDWAGAEWNTIGGFGLMAFSNDLTTAGHDWNNNNYVASYWADAEGDRGEGLAPFPGVFYDTNNEGASGTELTRAERLQMLSGDEAALEALIHPLVEKNPYLPLSDGQVVCDACTHVDGRAGGPSWTELYPKRRNWLDWASTLPTIETAAIGGVNEKCTSDSLWGTIQALPRNPGYIELPQLSSDEICRKKCFAVPECNYYSITGDGFCEGYATCENTAVSSVRYKAGGWIYHGFEPHVDPVISSSGDAFDFSQSTVPQINYARCYPDGDAGHDVNVVMSKSSYDPDIGPARHQVSGGTDNVERCMNLCRNTAGCKYVTVWLSDTATGHGDGGDDTSGWCLGYRTCDNPTQHKEDGDAQHSVTAEICSINKPCEVSADSVQNALCGPSLQPCSDAAADAPIVETFQVLTPKDSATTPDMDPISVPEATRDRDGTIRYDDYLRWDPVSKTDESWQVPMMDGRSIGRWGKMLQNTKESEWESQQKWQYTSVSADLPFTHGQTHCNSESEYLPHWAGAWSTVVVEDERACGLRCATDSRCNYFTTWSNRDDGVLFMCELYTVCFDRCSDFLPASGTYSEGACESEVSGGVSAYDLYDVRTVRKCGYDSEQCDGETFTYEAPPAGTPSDGETTSPTSFPTTYPTYAAGDEGTGAPTKAPTEGTEGTEAPTKAPTKAPTTAATNPPKPEYEESEFEYLLSEETVDLSTVEITLSPTVAPTPYPTAAGEAAVQKQVEVAVVATDIAFPLSEEEASNVAMQASLAEGMANALGLEMGAVSVTHVNGVSVSASRRLVGADVSITFLIESASSAPGQVLALQETIRAAASEGSIVANVQAAAFTNGVLVSSLRDMPRVLPVPTMEESTKMITITVVEEVSACDEEKYQAEMQSCRSKNNLCKAALQATESPEQRMNTLCDCISSSSGECTSNTGCALGWSCINDALLASSCHAPADDKRLNPQLAALRQVCGVGSIQAIRDDVCLGPVVQDTESNPAQCN
jgi:hypothetical protein